ncbi:MAG: hypothetical protein EBW20_10390, partial [Betaproteobacteria bacterium]|nr:hypothetical protein [Betaproteobacteria bacterium]
CLRTVLDFWNAPGRFRWPLFALALAGALASAAMLSPHLRIDAEPTLPPPPSQIEVIVAKQSLNPGDVLSKDNLAVGKVQKDFYDEAMLSPDRFSDIDGLVMMQTLAPGQALWTTHLAKPEHRHPSLGLRRIQLVLDDRYGFKQLANARLGLSGQAAVGSQSLMHRSRCSQLIPINGAAAFNARLSSSLRHWDASRLARASCFVMSTRSQVPSTCSVGFASAMEIAKQDRIMARRSFRLDIAGME